MKILVTKSNEEKIKKELDAVQARYKAQLTDVCTIYKEAEKLKAAIKCFINLKYTDDVRKYTRYIKSDHSISRWQALAENRFNELIEKAKEV